MLDRGRLAPRADQPRCSRRAPAASASPSRSRAATATRYRVTGRPVPPTVDRPRRRPRARSASAPDETVVLVFGGSLGARSINQAAVEAFADAPYRVLHVAGRRDFAELARARRRTTPARLHRPVRQRARGRRPRRRPRRRLGVRARPVRAAGGPDPVPARLRPTTRPPTRAGWRDAGAAVVIRRRRADAGAPARARSTRSRSTRRACARWRRPSARARAPRRRARRSRARCSPRRARAANGVAAARAPELASAGQAI